MTLWPKAIIADDTCVQTCRECEKASSPYDGATGMSNPEPIMPEGVIGIRHRAKFDGPRKSRPSRRYAADLTVENLVHAASTSTVFHWRGKFG